MALNNEDLLIRLYEVGLVSRIEIIDKPSGNILDTLSLNQARDIYFKQDLLLEQTLINKTIWLRLVSSINKKDNYSILVSPWYPQYTARIGNSIPPNNLNKCCKHNPEMVAGSCDLVEKNPGGTCLDAEFDLLNFSCVVIKNE